MVNYQTTTRLVQSTQHLLVQDHLGQFSLNDCLLEGEFSGDVSDIDSSVGFDYFEQIFFKEVFVEKLRVAVDDLVSLDLSFELSEHPAESHNRCPKMSLSHSLDRLDMAISRILESKLSAEQSLEIFSIVAHNLTHEHILEA